jgi:predicted Zn-dependent peptidase
MTQVDDVATFSLANGMKMIVLEDHSIPNACLFIFWKVGSRNEVPGITGLSHFFEHMMFNGAQKYGPKQFDRVMEAHGGSNNAFTSEDVTAYFDNFPVETAPLIFELEADRIGHLALDPCMVESERGVVTSERTTGLENNPWELLSEKLRAVAFEASPYRWSVIGYDSDIKNWSRQDLQTYFQTYYAPNNAVAVLVGDMTVDQVKALAKTWFEPIPAHAPPRPVHTVEPNQLGEKRLWVHKDVSATHLMIAYHAPEAQSPEYYAMDILASILSEGKSSRLVSSLVDTQQVAIEVSADCPRSFDRNLFCISAVAHHGVTAETLEKAIEREIQALIAKGVTQRELVACQNRKLVEFYRSMETLTGKASTLGTYELFFGDYRKLFTAPQAYRQVTAKDVQAMAAKYLVPANRTVGILCPAKESVHGL